MNKLPVISTTALIVAAFILVLPVFGKGKGKLTTSQQAAKSVCSKNYLADVNRCADGDMTCIHRAEQKYLECMDAAGIPRLDNPPPVQPRGPHNIPTNAPTSIGTASATPHKFVPGKTASVAPLKLNSPTPTATPKRRLPENHKQ